MPAKKLTEYELNIKSQQLYGDIYNLDFSTFINTRTRIDIYCKKHNIIFKPILANYLYQGQVCPICVNEKSGYVRTQEDFVDKAEKLHFDKIKNSPKYDYSKTNYKNTYSEISIICKKHNFEFSTTPNKHLSEKIGCPICGKPRCGFKNSNMFSTGYFYCVNLYNNLENFIKFGVTSTEVSLRISKLPNTYDKKILYTFQDTLTNISEIEYEITTANIIRKFNYIPKIKFDGSGECYNVQLFNHIPLNRIIQFCNQFVST